ALHREAVLLEYAGQILRRLDFLEPKLAEAENLIDHLLRQRRQAVDQPDRLGFERRHPCVVRWEHGREWIGLRGAAATTTSTTALGEYRSRENEKQAERSAKDSGHVGLGEGMGVDSRGRVPRKQGGTLLT